MNRTQLAATVASAYFSQYINDEGVTNDPIIIFNKGTQEFDWLDILTPLQDNEIQVDTLEDGMFGDPEDEKGLAEWLAKENDDYWSFIVEAIERPN